MAAHGLLAVLALRVDYAMHSINMTNDSSKNNLNGLAWYLICDELLNVQAAQAALIDSAQQGISLTRHLVQSNILSSQKILQCCVNHCNFPVFDLKEYNNNWLHDPLIKSELIYRYRVIPLNRDQNTLYLGITDPTDHAAISAVGFHTGLRIRPMLVSEAELDMILQAHSRTNKLGSHLESALSKITPIEESSPHDEMTEHDDEPVSEFVDRLIRDAIEKQISDIHIEPFIHHCRIRFRRDGLLYEAATTPPHLAMRIITRLKIMSNLNIAERRLPQDGRLQLPQKLGVDIRINTCPTLFGEKIVLRLLDANTIKLDIDALGFTTAQKKIFISKLKQPQGLILVTGPTGSGKTITLYSALHYLNQIEKNISSVEDPVEIEFPGINQVSIHPRIGLDFAVALRTFLRQDPDIIMVGEIRDLETANIAMQAAQTGHLVLSTLHTNSAIEAITRLHSMGAVAYNFINSVSLIIAQRLVRKLCGYCKQPERVTSDYHILHGSAHIVYRPLGCNRCYHGYQGRIGIFELIPMTEKIAELILLGASTIQIVEAIKKEEWMLLWDAGMEMVKSGLTSYVELMRVVGKNEKLQRL